jgi:dynein heavy chain, axonemal
MYIILLIWTNSVYYKTASRLVVLIREICNTIISQANEYVKGKTLLDEIQSKDDVENACKKLDITIDVCAKFKDTYYDYKSMSENQWKFPQNVLFIRLDSFLERCHDIASISKTIVQFNKLDSIQIGGTKGKNLTETVKIIFTQFNEAV